MRNFFRKQNRGYTLLFAVLVSSLVLAIGISILNITKKEFLIATSTRDSSAALYAADSGLECAIYGDTGTVNGIRRNAFSMSGDRTQYLGCVSNYTVSFEEVDYTNGDFKFHIRFGTEKDSCAVVTVSKYYEMVEGENRLVTNILSRGYNTGWQTTDTTTNEGRCDVPSAKRVERALSYTTY